MSTFHDSISKFQYKPLDSPDSIRILLLHPSSASPAHLHCDLIQTTISACDQDLFEHYVALSYVWGSTDDLQTILLEGCHFQITRNLSEALHNIRESSRAVRLWVDAVCINQHDNSERNHQVALMGQIYTIARHTIIYLGPSSQDIDAVLQLSAAPKEDINLQERQSWKTPQNPQISLVARELLSRAWFTRIWVFQELVLSRDPWVQCGKSRSKWAAFCRVMFDAEMVDDSNINIPKNPDYIVPERPNSLLEMLRSLQDVRNRRWLQTFERRGFSAHTLVSLVRSRRGLGATDPRDIIYGHMSLAPSLVATPSLMERSPSTRPLHEIEILRKFEDRFNLVTPAYHKSVEEVFMDFAHDVINRCGHLGIFCYKESISPSERRRNLASWAPDWTVHPLKQPQFMTENIWQRDDQSWRNLKYGPHSWIPDSRILLISADRFGTKSPETILEVSQVIPWHVSNILLSESHQKLLEKDLHSSMNTLRKDDSRWGWFCELYEKIYTHYFEMLGGQYLPKLEYGTIPDLLQLLTTSLEIHSYYSVSNFMYLPDLFFAHAFNAKERSILAGRRLASLNSGRTALVPPMAQAGDVMYRLDRRSSFEEKSDCTFVFRSLSREVADNRMREMSVLQIKALDEFRQVFFHGRKSEEYQHCILLGQGRIFGSESIDRKMDWRIHSQLLVVH
ncbi:Heterokaryon incompatibility protein (HET) domain containing protein [Hyaloscypha variabilis]